MIDIASIGVSTVIDQNYRRKAQLCLSGLFVTVSITTVYLVYFPCVTKCISSVFTSGYVLALHFIDGLLHVHI